MDMATFASDNKSKKPHMYSLLKITSVGFILSFIIYSNLSLSYVDGDGPDLVVDAPWRTVRDYLPVLFFTPEFKEGQSARVTNITLYNFDPETKNKSLIFRDYRSDHPGIAKKDDFKCDVTFIDPNGFNRAPSTADENINNFWHYIARVPTSCIGMGKKLGQPGVHYLQGQIDWVRSLTFGSTGQPQKEFKILRVVVSNDNLAKFSVVDHYYDVHVHTIAEQTKWHGITNVDASKKAFGGPLAMLMESAYATGMVDTQLKDANWTVFKNKIITTDHNSFFSGGDYDAGTSPGYGPTANTNGKKGEFEWYRKNLGVLGGEEITVKGANGQEAIGSLEIDDITSRNFGIGLDGELGLGSHLLSYGSPHFEGPWHGGHVLKNALIKGAPNSISITHAISHMGSTNGFGYAAHPESGNFKWSFEYFDRAIGLAPFNIGGANSKILQKNGDDFVFKGVQVWNGHGDMKSSKSGDLEVSESHHFHPFTPNSTREKFEYRPDWRKGHDKTYSRYKWLLKRGLSYSFDDSRDYKFIRKLYMSAGTDAHGDFNYEMSILAHSPVEAAGIFSVDLNIMNADNNAFGRMRTYTLTSQRYVRAGASIPPRCASFPFCSDGADRKAPSYYPVEDYKEGNTVITDGPIGRFSIDGNCRFNSDYHQLVWHDSFCKWENHDGMIGGRGKFDGGNTLLAPVGNDDVYLNAQWIGKNDYLPDSAGDRGAMTFTLEKINSSTSTTKSDRESFAAGRRHGLHIVSLNEVLKSPPILAFPNKSALIMEGELSIPENETKFITNPVWMAPYKFSIDSPSTCPIKPGELKIGIEFGLSMDPTLPVVPRSTGELVQGSAINNQNQQGALIIPDTALGDPHRVYKGIEVRLKPLNSLGNSSELEYLLTDENSVWSAVEIPREFTPSLIQDAKLTLTNSMPIPCSVGGWDSSSKTANSKVSSYAVVVDQIYDMFHNYLNPIGTVFSVKKPRSPKDIFDKPSAPKTGPIAISGDDKKLTCSNIDSQVCKNNSASCEILLSKNNSKTIVCRWSSRTTEQQCLKTKGMWTSLTSKYARIHPNAVPLGQEGACITERKNIKNKGFIWHQLEKNR